MTQSGTVEMKQCKKGGNNEVIDCEMEHSFCLLSWNVTRDDLLYKVCLGGDGTPLLFPVDQ